ncbi:hypothetical protein ACFCX0_48330 [Streptomyces sp. NPDC056352]|uniref:hypothetical protein n=1 Tax=Streptomyces sp. NPDC056352 TaxID=3345791 RepID=UPI0035E35D6A
MAEWRSQGWRPVLDGGQRYDGWTETVTLLAATADRLWRGILGLDALTGTTPLVVRDQSPAGSDER